MALTATPLSAADVQKQMAANSEAWKTASAADKITLHDQNLALAKQTGQTYNSGTGTYSAPVAATPKQLPFITPGGTTAYRDQRPGDTGYVAPKTGGDLFGAASNVNDTSQQQKIVNPSVPVAATATPSQSSYPGQLTTAQIAAEAQARIDKQRAALMGAVTGAKTGLKNTYDYTQGLQKDNRALEDAQNQRTLNPFSGGTDYKTAMLSRDRQIADTASSKDYNNAVAGYDQQVASFDTLSAEQQQSIIDDLTRQERDYGLQVGSLTGQFNGQQTLAAKTADQNYGLGLAGLSGQMPASSGGGQTLAAQQLASQQQNQAFNQNLQTNQYNQDVNNTKFNQDLQTKQFDYQKAQQDWSNAFAKEQYSDQKAQQVWDNTFKDNSFKQSVNQFAQQLGLDYSKMNQSQQQFVADQAFKQKSLDAQNNPNSLDNKYKQAQIDSLTNKTDTAISNQGKLDLKAFETERDGMINSVRTGKVDIPTAMAQINQDEQLGIYASDLAEKLRGNLRVLNNNQPISGDTNASSGIKIDPSKISLGNSTVTGNVFGG